MRKIGMKLLLVAGLVTAGVFTAARLHAEDQAAGPAALNHPAPGFELTNVATGETSRLSDHKGKIVVLHFQSVQCPWEGVYQPILNQIAAKYPPKEVDGVMVEQVVFLGINSNRTEDIEAIKKDIDRKSIPYAILKDTNNVVADLYAATTTPHIYVINNDEAQTLVYKGGIEKAPSSPADAGDQPEQYLVPVLDALTTAATPPFTETVEIGCSIKRVKKST